MDDWDWELLHDSRETKPTTDQQQEETVVVKKIEGEVEEKPISFSYDIDGDNSGVFRSDYFSIDSHLHDHNYVEDEDEDGGDSSDNPSWIDPSNSSVTGGRGPRIRSSSSNSDSSGPTSDSLRLIESHHSNCEYALNSTHGVNIDSENPIEIKAQEKDDVEEGEVDEVLHPLGDNNGGGNERVVRGEEREANSWLNEEKKEKVVWWKVPLEVLRYCVLRVSPVWSLSMAAAAVAVMGFIIFRRRYLYKMKRKTQGLQLKVTVDDKKVSQFESHVARLNEAFSVVKRVPVIRPSLPPPGLAPWPVMSIR